MFDWDEAKNRDNVAKHGVSFAFASRIFEGPVFTWFDDRFEYGETREISIGMVDGAVVLAVVHTDRNGLTRIISARPATRMERIRYGEALRKGLVG
jgi:uncharacterized protein